MRFGVLGPLTVWTDEGEVVPIPGLKVRALLADLLAHEGRVVSADRLVDDLWGDDVPGNATAALQVRVSQLRRALEDAEPGGKNLVVSRAPGYRLQVDPDAVDAMRFGRLLGESRLEEALELWRGAAFADFSDFAFARPVAVRLEEARLGAVEELAEIRLAAGEPVEVSELVDAHPLRERLRAVHMKALYRAGRQSEALASYGRLREQLAEELGLDPSPELAALHEQILRQDPALSGPERRPSGNLPAAVGELIGRDEAAAEVRALLEAGRLVTLTGPGGVGKTSLALETARKLAGAFADGAWLVELAAYGRRTPSLAEAVLAVLDIRDGGDAPDALDRLAGALAARDMLLVLDNCEHVVDQAAKLAEMLLRAAPGLRILATSREPLAVAGEALWSVPALEVPDGGGLDEVAGSDAVRLFVARAAASARGFALDAGNAEAVAQLCRRLDGLPLALELAATRVRAFGVDELVARLDDRFRMLAGWQRGAPERQQTLMATIDWSWTLLTSEERTVLRRLAVHADGCTLEAAEAVCAEPGLDVLDLLARLVDRSLVTVVEGPSGMRYRLLESVAAYCLRRLDDAGETSRIRQAHVRYFMTLAVQAQPHLRGGEQARWMRRLDAEAANLRAALDAAPAGGALRLANALAWYWFLRGRLGEGRAALAKALAKAPDEAPDEALHGVPDEVSSGQAGDVERADGAERARARAWEAGFALLLGEDADWAEALRRIEDPGDRARAQWFVSLGLADQRAARDLVDEALAVFREIGDRWGAAAALSRRARDAFTRRDHAVLERDGGESVRIFGELGDRWGRLQADEWLGGLAQMRRDYDGAARLFGKGLGTAEELGLWPDAVRRLSWLGWIAMDGADYDRALDLCARAMRLAAGQDYREGQVFAEMGYAFAARRAGRLELADKHLNNLLEGVPRGGEPVLFLPDVLVELGFASELRGDPDTARTLFLEVLAAAEEIGDPGTMTLAVEGLASVSSGEKAAELLGLAASARMAHGTPPSESERAELDRITRRVRSGLGEDAFAAAYARGRELTLTDACP
ncbi:winged helix-turn-helix domain-containing protein [Planomonospora sp. ID67723]|uniref:BTAD domain-containing putative transcriptional regulator n=1 Tax=Planomonospora sp. ID67723 TaxID=2738134 RepID=UPI0018C391FA|nr:BTAD domain-containing putative transcriptional regulator [Planomonospora sp. ID67723]MBG0830952.1 winged helix-turn-helix domain-containing protein [Planomonospora sp. ID67723]